MATIKVKRSSVEGRIPLTTDLELGEFAVNTHDGKLFLKRNDSLQDYIVEVGGTQGFDVLNQTANTITKGTLVRFAGTVGASGKLLIEPFLANNTYSSDYFMGVVQETIPSGSTGFVIDHGKIRKINTSAYAPGTILYASSTTAGAFTSTQPTAPNNKITVAAVINQHANNGTLQIRISRGSQLGNDELVELDSLAQDQTLVYNNTAGRFENSGVKTINGESLFGTGDIEISGGGGTALQNRYSYTATAAQTTFSAEYTAPYVDVYLNGLRLSSGVDYTATNGTAIVLTDAAVVNDLVEIVAQVATTTVLVDDTKLPLAGGTMTGAIGFAAGQTFPGTQTALVSGTSIKTVNGQSVLGSGNIQIDGGVTSFNTRTGAVTLGSLDVTTALGFTPVAQSAIDASISALVASAPSTLDTLNELASALGNDANFATTVTNSIAAKLPLTGGTMTGAISFAAGQTWPTFNQSTTGTASNVTGTVAVANGGTGQTTYTDGQLLIGNTTGNTLAKATLTPGTGITITNGAGAITINASAATPTVAGIVFGRTGNNTACCGGKIALGLNAGLTNQSSSAVAIGKDAAYSDQQCGSVAIGFAAGNTGQYYYSVAVGSTAGNANQQQNAVAVGASAGNSNQGGCSVAVGNSAGSLCQGSGSVAIGASAGLFSQSGSAVAIGKCAAFYGQSVNAVAIGTFAGNGTQGICSVAIGSNSGRCFQGGNTVAIGAYAGYCAQGTYGIAIGSCAGFGGQGQGGIAIGQNAGNASQYCLAIAIGTNAGGGSQGLQAIAIGSCAGASSQHANSIIISAQGSPLNSAGTSRAYMAPIRNSNGEAYGLMYNPTSKEITYSTVRAFYQATPISKTAGATLTAAEVLTGMLTYSGVAAYLTMPTGTLLNTAQGTIAVNTTFYFTVINIGTTTASLIGNTGITVVGNQTINGNDSGTFAIRYTAANTYIAYRI